MDRQKITGATVIDLKKASEKRGVEQVYLPCSANVTNPG